MSNTWGTQTLPEKTEQKHGIDDHTYMPLFNVVSHKIIKDSRQSAKGTTCGGLNIKKYDFPSNPGFRLLVASHCCMHTAAISTTKAAFIDFTLCY